MLTMYSDARRKVVRLLGEIKPPSNVRRAGRHANGEGLARCSRPPVTLGPPLSRLRAACVTKCPLRGVLGAF
jgi:hypothetical protein